MYLANALVFIEKPVFFQSGTAFPVGETLSVALTCANIKPVHPGVPLPLVPNLLWQLTTHLYLNHVTLGSAEHLRTLLQLYLSHDTSSGFPLTANLKRVGGIEDVAVTPDEATVEGVPLQGSHLRLKVRGDHFAGAGDLYLFGCVLERFLEEYASINCFTRLTVDEQTRGESYQWPMRQEPHRS